MNSERVRQKLEELDVVPMLADLSRPDEMVKGFLIAFEHPSIPYYMVIPPDGPILWLDAVITPKQVVKLLERANEGEGESDEAVASN